MVGETLPDRLITKIKNDDKAYYGYLKLTEEEERYRRMGLLKEAHGDDDARGAPSRAASLTSVRDHPRPGVLCSSSTRTNPSKVTELFVLSTLYLL